MVRWHSSTRTAGCQCWTKCNCALSRVFTIYTALPIPRKPTTGELTITPLNKMARCECATCGTIGSWDKMLLRVYSVFKVRFVNNNHDCVKFYFSVCVGKENGIKVYSSQFSKRAFISSAYPDRFVLEDLPSIK